MPGIMFDSDNTAVLVEDRFKGCRIATYADLLTSDLVRQLAGRLVVIDRGHGDPLGLATVADIEPGCLTVAEGADKIRQWTSEHRPGVTGYCDRSEWPEVKAAVADLHPWYWIATLDGTGNPDGEYPAVVQVLGQAQLGLPVDCSIVWDDRWHPMPPGLPGSSLFDLRRMTAALRADAAELSRIVAQV